MHPTSATSQQGNKGEPITIVVQRRVLPDCEAEFEAAMREFTDFAFQFPGHLDLHVLRPGAGTPRDFTVIDRFTDLESRAAFTSSPGYAKWMQRLRALTEADPHIEVMGGLAGWFTLPGRTAPRAPSRPKMAAVTFLGVFPLTSLLPRSVAALTPGWHPLAQNVVVTALIVATLTWVVMPLLTRVFARWLFPDRN